MAIVGVALAVNVTLYFNSPLDTVPFAVPSTVPILRSTTKLPWQSWIATGHSDGGRGTRHACRVINALACLSPLFADSAIS